MVQGDVVRTRAHAGQQDTRTLVVSLDDRVVAQQACPPWFWQDDVRDRSIGSAAQDTG